MKVVSCSACLDPLGKDDYSKNQWKKTKDNQQRCKSCVDARRYSLPIVEWMEVLQHLPRDLRGRALEMAKKDHPLPPLLLGMISSADAFAEYAGIDIQDFIMSPQFAAVIKQYELEMNPAIRAQTKIAEQAETIRKLEEELAYLKHDYDSLENRHERRKSKCTHYRRLFEEEILGSEYFFQQTSKFLKALLRLSRRSETRNARHVPLGLHYRNRDEERPSWQQAVVQSARDHMTLRLPLMRDLWRLEPDSRGLICIPCSCLQGTDSQPVRNCGCDGEVV